MALPPFFYSFIFFVFFLFFFLSVLPLFSPLHVDLLTLIPSVLHWRAVFASVTHAQSLVWIVLFFLLLSFYSRFFILFLLLPSDPLSFVPFVLSFAIRQ